MVHGPTTLIEQGVSFVRESRGLSHSDEGASELPVAICIALGQGNLGKPCKVGGSVPLASSSLLR